MGSARQNDIEEHWRKKAASIGEEKEEKGNKREQKKRKDLRKEKKHEK